MGGFACLAGNNRPYSLISSKRDKIDVLISKLK
jgi:hypothetical protein